METVTHARAVLRACETETRRAGRPSSTTATGHGHGRRGGSFRAFSPVTNSRYTSFPDGQQLDHREFVATLLMRNEVGR